MVKIEEVKTQVDRFCQGVDNLRKEYGVNGHEIHKATQKAARHGLAATITAGIALTGKTILKALNIIS